MCGKALPYRLPVFQKATRGYASREVGGIDSQSNKTVQRKGEAFPHIGRQSRRAWFAFAPMLSENESLPISKSLADRKLCAGHNTSSRHFAKIRLTPKSFRTNCCCARESCANFPQASILICRSGSASLCGSCRFCAKR